MSDTKGELCGFDYSHLIPKKNGYQLLGATRPPLKRPPPPGPKAKSPAGAVANATAAAARAVTAGNAAVAASKRKPKQKQLSKIAGLGETSNMHLLGINERRSIYLMGLGETSNEFLLADGSDVNNGEVVIGLNEKRHDYFLDRHTLPGMECLGIDERRSLFSYLDSLGVDTDEPGAAYAAEAAYEILGAAGASPATRALAARAAASSAALAAARAKAAAAPTKIAKANASVEKHGAKIASHAVKAEAAGAKGKAALAQGKVASAAIAESVKKLGKLGFKTMLGAAPEDFVYQKMPLDAVQYKGPWERYSKGSVSYFKTSDPDRWGLIWGWTPVHGGDPLAENPDVNAHGSVEWIQRTGVGAPQGKGGMGTADFAAAAATGGMSLIASQIATETGMRNKEGGRFPVQNLGPMPDKAVAKLSLSPGQRDNDPTGNSWGPLIGNPNNPKYAGLRYAVEEDKWFWLADEAPAFATKERDDEIALLAKRTEEANNAATAAAEAEAEALLAQQEADALALATKIELEDAALARAAQVQADQLALADEKLQAELAAQQARDDAAYATAQGQIDLERQRQDLARQAAQDARDAARPVEQYAPSSQEYGEPTRDDYGRGVADGHYGGGENGGGARGAGMHSGSGNFDESDVAYQEGADDRGLPFPGEE